MKQFRFWCGIPLALCALLSTGSSASPACEGVFVRQIGPSVVPEGSIAIFEIRIVNEGVCDLKEGSVTDTLPAHSALRRAAPEPESGLPVLWKGVHLPAAGGESRFLVEVLIAGSSGGASPRVATNTACFEHPGIGQVCGKFETFIRPPDSVSVQQPRPYLMAALGDSITAASFSDLPIPPRDPDAEAWLQERVRQEYQPEIIAQNRKTFSWVSGLRVKSHFVRLREWLRESGERRGLKMLNVSEPGKESRHMAEQANRVAEAMHSGSYSSLAYVTLFIGSNDACSHRPTPVLQMRSELMAALSILAGIQQHDPIRVLLVGLFRIPDLGAPAIRDHSTVFGLSCNTVRNRILKMCNPLLSWEPPEQYARAVTVVDERNAVLAEVARAARKSFPNLDVAFSSRLYGIPLPVDYLAFDCFHPSAKGHEAISNELWADQPWFK